MLRVGRHDLHPLPPPKPPVAAGSLYSSQTTLANVFATPLSQNPVISSGPFKCPLGKDPDFQKKSCPPHLEILLAMAKDAFQNIKNKYGHQNKGEKNIRIVSAIIWQ
ncbi:hypothetical protein PoB_005463100 [Plakobranchus ocellatus]|uniref:Uncharacterized protein n=1 Tax=Plakobranchus ocellatus TaxID=259542 RepID=A0AAV4C9X6_9GAST|nr:hypothetical protein PoB_005463100 [Plakobranchus ocellatus]